MNFTMLQGLVTTFAGFRNNSNEKMNGLRLCKNICHVISIVKTDEVLRCIILVPVRDDVIAHRPSAFCQA